jgi:hypothetical protein
MTTLTLILAIFIAQGSPEPIQEALAAMRLGARAAHVQRNLPVLNQVVLVPDEATYLDEISRWSPRARWPVLFDREPLASQFIRRFNPEKIWRRESVNTKIDDIEIAMQRAVASAWGGTDSIESALAYLKLPPLGVVLTSTKDSARTGAVALAAGRGQLLEYISGEWGTTGETLDGPRTKSLIREIEGVLKSTGTKYADIGDTIDALTICQTLPSRVTSSAARENPVAVSDVIGRDLSGKRFAWTGWIFGTKSQSAYVAMCSLYLQRETYWFCNTYPSTGMWANYGLGNIPEILTQYGLKPKTMKGTVGQLQQADKGGLSTDMIFFTSKGNSDFLEMSDGKTSPTWLPILNTPTALYFLHSWSLKNPQSKSTVGGTWLSRGVYAYIGSSHEPFLKAFVPPVEILRRTMSKMPLLPASRWFDGEGVYSKVWRLNTIGDPLMLCGPKDAVQRQLVAAKSSPDYHDQTIVARGAMQNAVETPSDENFSDAINAVILLGKDDLASGLWRVAFGQSSTGPESAAVALPALFRQQEVDSFLMAFKLLRSPSRIERDMLWHLVGTSNSTSLQLLIDNIRNPYSLDDLTVIADRIASTRGPAAVLAIIEEKLLGARRRTKRGLERMRKEYGG